MAIDVRNLLNKSMKSIGGFFANRLVNDVTMSTDVLAISAESVTFSAGAQGTTGVVGVDKAPVYDSTGTGVGYYQTGSDSDSSFEFVTGTVLTDEVRWREDLTDSEQLALLENGEFAVDYVNGKIRYCKDTAGTSDTVNYTIRRLTMTSGGVASAVDVDKVGGTTTDTNSGNKSAGSMRVVLATDDINTAIIASDTSSIDGKITAVDTGAVVVASGAITETNSATIAGDTTSLDGKVTACNTGATVIASGTITAVTDITNTVTVDATDLDIRDLTSASDSVEIVKPTSLSNTFTQLTAVGVTAAFAVPKVKTHNFAVTVASIDTNVVVSCEGSLDGTNFDNLDVNDNSTTITANGTTLFKYSGDLTHIRFNFESEAGGTAVTIDVKYLGGF